MEMNRAGRRRQAKADRNVKNGERHWKIAKQAYKEKQAIAARVARKQEAAHKRAVLRKEARKAALVGIAQPHLTYGSRRLSTT